MRASDRDGERVQGLSGPRTAAALLISTALALYGLVFLSNAIPDWIGYGLLLLAAATFPGLSLRILPPTAVYLEMVLAGFTFLLT